MNREEILQRLRYDVSLPALPEVLARLDEVLGDPDVDVRNVSHLVATDPVLAGQVLHMANSAYYSRGGTPATTLASGIQRLGLRTLRGLVYALTLPRIFSNSPGQFPMRNLWRHGLAVAAFSRELSIKLGGSVEEREQVYLAGLVHDVGALVFASLAPEIYVPWLKDAESKAEAEGWNEKDLAVLEQETFGIDHAELGAMFLNTHWKLPSKVVAVARYHHELGWEDELIDDSCRKNISIVHVANGICNHDGVRWDAILPEGRAFRESAWEYLDLPLDIVDELMDKVRESLKLAESLLAAGGNHE